VWSMSLNNRVRTPSSYSIPYRIGLILNFAQFMKFG
jgi:hypothetical protein